MARRKSKKPQPEETPIVLDSPVTSPQSKTRINSGASPALLVIMIFTVGASTMGWFVAQQQHSIDRLSASFTTMQERVTNLQQVMQMTDAQTDTGLVLEERIRALKEAQKQAQERAEVALAISEKLKNSNLYSQLLDLRDEIGTRLTELKQVSLSVTTLQAMIKNQSEEFEAVKESVMAGLHSSSAVAENVVGLTNAVASAYSRGDKQVASEEALNAQLAGQASELNELKETMHLHNVAIYTNNQEVAAIKDLVEAKQAMRAQALEELLSSVQMTLDEQFLTSQILHSSITAQLQTFHTQLSSASTQSMKLKSNEESPAAEEFISTAAENVTEMQEMLEDVEQKTEQQDTEDEAEEEAKEEEAMQDEQTLEQEVEKDVTEEQGEEEITEDEEEITPEEQEDEEITGQTEEQEAAGETAEEQVEEETVDGHILDDSLEEDVSEEVVESLETIEEESGELNSEVFMDKNEEDE